MGSCLPGVSPELNMVAENKEGKIAGSWEWKNLNARKKSLDFIWKTVLSHLCFWKNSRILFFFF